MTCIESCGYLVRTRACSASAVCLAALQVHAAPSSRKGPRAGTRPPSSAARSPRPRSRGPTAGPAARAAAGQRVAAVPAPPSGTPRGRRQAHGSPRHPRARLATCRRAAAHCAPSPPCRSPARPRSATAVLPVYSPAGRRPADRDPCPSASRRKRAAARSRRACAPPSGSAPACRRTAPGSPAVRVPARSGGVPPCHRPPGGRARAGPRPRRRRRAGAGVILP